MYSCGNACVCLYQIDEKIRRKEEEKRLEEELEKKLAAQAAENSPSRKKKQVRDSQEPQRGSEPLDASTSAAPGQGDNIHRIRLEKAAAAAAASMHQRATDRSSARDRARDESESPPPTHRHHRDPHHRPRNTPPSSPPHIPRVYPSLVDELGIRPSTADSKSLYQEVGRRAATPGGSLESESHLVPVGAVNESRRGGFGNGINQQSRSRLHTIDEDYRKYRHNVDDDDLLVVDWQHQHGFSTKRGTTPRENRRSVHQDEAGRHWRGDRAFEEPSIVSDSTLVDPTYGPNGLLAELTVQRLPPEPRFIRRPKGVQDKEDQLSMVERSLTSESFLMYAGNRTPHGSEPSSRKGSAHVPRRIEVSFDEKLTLFSGKIWQ